MATIHIEKPITTPPDDLMKLFESKVLSLPNLKMFVDGYQVEGRSVTFGGSKGINGRAEAREGVLVVDVELTGMAALMKPLVESKLNEVLGGLE